MNDMPTPMPAPLSDMAAIRHYFFEGVPIAQFSPQFKALSPETKQQLADAIRDGSLTY